MADIVSILNTTAQVAGILAELGVTLLGADERRPAEGEARARGARYDGGSGTYTTGDVTWSSGFSYDPYTYGTRIYATGSDELLLNVVNTNEQYYGVCPGVLIPLAKDVTTDVTSTLAPFQAGGGLTATSATDTDDRLIRAGGGRARAVSLAVSSLAPALKVPILSGVTFSVTDSGGSPQLVFSVARTFSANFTATINNQQSSAVVSGAIAQDDDGNQEYAFPIPSFLNVGSTAPAVDWMEIVMVVPQDDIGAMAEIRTINGRAVAIRPAA